MITKPKTQFSEELRQLEMSKKMIDELDEMIKNFSPKFGDEMHIEIVKNISLLNSLIIKQKKRYERTIIKRVQFDKPFLGQQKLENWGVKIRKLKRKLHWQLQTYGKSDTKK